MTSQPKTSKVVSVVKGEPTSPDPLERIVENRWPDQPKKTEYPVHAEVEEIGTIIEETMAEYLAITFEEFKSTNPTIGKTRVARI